MKQHHLKGLEGPIALALETRLKLPAETVTKLLAFGAVVVRARGKGAHQRVRAPGHVLHPTDEVQVAHDPRVLAMPAFKAAPAIWECAHYGVWFKPAGIMSQGSPAGDHCSLMYAVEQMGRTPYLVHRLDRETEGLMLVAYNGKAAGVLSDMFQKQLIQKTYLALVAHPEALGGPEGLIDLPLDGKPSQTKFRVIKDLAANRALVELSPLTGRLHQIRRHLALMGSGVMGDPKYGVGNKNREGMKLSAISLKFFDSWSKQDRHFTFKASFAEASS